MSEELSPRDRSLILADLNAVNAYYEPNPEYVTKVVEDGRRHEIEIRGTKYLNAETYLMQKVYDVAEKIGLDSKDPLTNLQAMLRAVIQLNAGRLHSDEFVGILAQGELTMATKSFQSKSTEEAITHSNNALTLMALQLDLK